MNNKLEQRNKQQHVNKLAQKFMCAMLSDGRWWDCHTRDFRAVARMAFSCADAFCIEEDERKR